MYNRKTTGYQKEINLFEAGKILYTSSVDISLPKGPSVNEREFCLGLQKTFGKRIHFLIPKPEKEIPEISSCRISFLKKCNYRNPYHLFLHQFHFAKKLQHILSCQQFDLVVTRLGLLPLGFLVGLTGKNIPLAIKHLTGKVDYGNLNDSALFHSLKNFIAIFHKTITKRILKKTIAVDTPTLAHLNAIKDTYKIGPDSVILIENATNTERFQPIDKNEAKKKCGLEKFNPIVGYVGGKPWERGGYELLSVAPAIIKKFPKVGFVIVGDGKGMAPLLNQIKRSKFSNIFYCPGLVDYKDVSLYMNSFDVGIAFDRPDRFSVVGNSNQKVRQYISCGKPVLATPGGNEFIVSHKLGSIIDTTKKDEIVNALEAWLSLNENDKILHSKKAVAFARESLSIEKAINQRVNFWNNRLQVYLQGKSR